jgi:arsenical pump membrane protein
MGSTAKRKSADANDSSPLSWLLGCLGIVGAAIAVGAAPGFAREAATQDWTPFVLILGLLLIGEAAEDDGVFRTVGSRLARSARNGVVLYAGVVLLIVSVTATLNLDTSVVFLTPILIATGRSRGRIEAPLLYGCLFLSNASSLFLPGSNLTNLIVLGEQHRPGAYFLSLMWPAAVAAVVVTASCVLVWGRKALLATSTSTITGQRMQFGSGVIALVLATILVLVLSNPAPAVLLVGIVVAVLRSRQGRSTLGATVSVLGIPVLVGLFGLCVAFGTLGRSWSEPVHLLAHASGPGTAALAAVLSLCINNLPAAALLSAHHVRYPAQLLVGLNLGPNAFMTGSLAWYLWLRAARAAGANPSVARAGRIGLVVVPLSIASALIALAIA